MLTKVLCVFVFTCTLLQYGHTFWWQETTTKAPDTILKHIPLTYFRTYTYQPLATYPFFGAGGAAGFAAPPYAPQTPLLTGVRYDTYANRFAPSVVAAAAKTTTSTTTTTTPPPPPPPTTTRTTTTTTTTTVAPTTTTRMKEITPPLSVAATSNYGSEYPTFNRRFYTSAFNQQNYYRPSYPYPEYSTFNPAAMKFGTIGRRSSSHIQFVPCMCPISVGLAAGLDEKNGMDSFLGESRQSVDDDDDDGDMELPLEEDEAKLAKEIEDKASNQDASSETEETQLLNKVDLERIEKLRTDAYHMMTSEKDD